jgi:hypothetical protein
MKTIVFLRHSPYPRMYNQLYALKKTKKYRLILLCRDFDETNLNILKNVFDEIYYYQPPLLDLKRFGFAQKSDDLPAIHTFKVLMTDNALGPFFEKISYRMRFYNILKNIDADVYNCCSSGELTELALKNFEKPVVMDLHNGTIMKGVENLSKEHYIRDKFCFEHVNGIIHRGSDFEINYYRNQGYKINCPLLNYLDYCNRDFFVNEKVKKLSSEDDEYHLVIMGGGMQSLHMLSMLKKFFRQKIHFHLYLVPYSTVWNVYKEYFKLDKTEKYFHLEKTVPFNEVPREISKYDFGTLISPSAVLDQRVSGLKVAGRGYRNFTYLEAGLPIIVSNRMEYGRKIVEKNKIGVAVKDNEYGSLSSILDNYNYKTLQNNVFKVREKLLIDDHIKELGDFYQSAIETNSK